MQRVYYNLHHSVQVRCTGKENRLLDCDFPEEFGVDYDGDSAYDYNSENSPAPSHAELPSSSGLTGTGCSIGSNRDNNRLAVICRQFEMTGAISAAISSPVNTLLKGWVI